jgi:hypothetical protein
MLTPTSKHSLTQRKEGTYQYILIYAADLGNLQLMYYATLQNDSRKFLPWSLHYYFPSYIMPASKREIKGKTQKKRRVLSRGELLLYSTRHRRLIPEVKLCIGRKCWIGYCHPILLLVLVQIKAFGNHELVPTTCFLGTVLQGCETNVFF